MEPVVNLNINDYEKLDDFSGKGGFGSVVKVCLKNDRKKFFAMKEISLSVLLQGPEKGLSENEVIDMIQNEIDILQKIKNEKIKMSCFPKFEGIILEKTHMQTTNFNIVCEFQPHSLSKLIQEHKGHGTFFEIDLVYKYAVSLLNGLAYLQCLDITHRDIKPSNILLDESKQKVTLIDYGLSLFVSRIRDLMRGNNQASLQSLIDIDPAGTLNYMAPEVIQELPKWNTYRADCFSFGIFLLELLALEKPKRSGDPGVLELNGLKSQTNNIREKVNQRNLNLERKKKKKFKTLNLIIRDSLQIDPQLRADFIDFIMKYFCNYNHPNKIRYHIMFEESCFTLNFETHKLFDKEEHKKIFKDKLRREEKINIGKLTGVLFDGLQFKNFLKPKKKSPAKVLLVTNQGKSYAQKYYAYQSSPESEIRSSNEIKILNELYFQPFLPRSLPKFFGYVQEMSHFETSKYNSLYFEFYPQNLRQYLIEKNNKAEIIKFTTLKALFFELVKGFAFLQSLGIVHCDLKPENMMVLSEEKIVIIDYNCASYVTAHTFFKGTLGYRSPEWVQVINEGKEDIPVELLYKSDVFVLGLVMLEIGGSYDGLKYQLEIESLQNLRDNVTISLNKFRNTYEADMNNNQENQDIVGILASCLEIKGADRPDFFGLFSQMIRINYRRKTKENLNKLKYHIFIEDASLDFLSEQEIDRIVLELQEEKKKIPKLCGFNCAHSVKYDFAFLICGILLRICSIATKGNNKFFDEAAKSEIKAVLIGNIFLDVIIIIFGLIAMLILWRKYSFKYKKMAFIGYFLIFASRLSLGIIFLLEGKPVENSNLRVAWNYEMISVFLFNFLGEIGVWIFYFFFFLKVNLKDKQILALLYLIVIFFRLFSFENMAVFWDSAKMSQRQAYHVVPWILLDDFLGVFHSLVFSSLTIHEKTLENGLLIGAVKGFYVFYFISRIVLGACFLTIAGEDVRLTKVWNYEIFYLIVVHTAYELIILNFIKRIRKESLFSHKMIIMIYISLILVITLILFLISLGTSINFLIAATQDMKDSYNIISGIMLFDFLIVGLMVFFCFLIIKFYGNGLTDEIKKAYIIKFKLIAIFALIFWIIRFIVAGMFLADIKNDNGLTNYHRKSGHLFSSDEKSRYQALDMVFNFEIFFLIFCSVIITLNSILIIRSQIKSMISFLDGSRP